MSTSVCMQDAVLSKTFHVCIKMFLFSGVMMCPDWKTEDGFDMQMGTNHFGHFAFTELVMPLIRKSAASGHHPR